MRTLFDQPEVERDIELADLQVGHSCSVIAINIQNPGAVRAQAILDYLSGGRHDVIVLTELTDKPAVRLLVDGLSALGYGTTPLGQAAPKEYHTLIFSRFAFDMLPVATESLRNRVKIIRLNVLPKAAFVYVVGVYG
jgi:hypothetical protein